MNNKKILLHGTFNTANFGDVLFSDIFNEEIKKVNKNFQVFVPNASEYVIEHTNIKNVKALSSYVKSDAIVFASGGYFGEPKTNSHKWNLRFMKRHFPVMFMSLITNKPVAIIGVGVGPLSSKIIRLAVKKLFNKAKVITVRDEESKAELIKMGVDNSINVTSDSAIYLFGQERKISNSSFIKSSLSEVPTQNIKVFYHLSTPIDKVDSNLIEGLRLFLSKNPNITLILGTDNTNIIIEKEKTKTILNNTNIVFADYTSPWALIDTLKNVEVIITSKLHVGIVGTMYNKSVISFSNHPKIKRYYNQLAISERSIPVKGLSSDQVDEQLCKYFKESYNMPENIREKSQNNFVYLEGFLNSL